MLLGLTLTRGMTCFWNPRSPDSGNVATDILHPCSTLGSFESNKYQTFPDHPDQRLGLDNLSVRMEMANEMIRLGSFFCIDDSWLSWSKQHADSQVRYESAPDGILVFLPLDPQLHRTIQGLSGAGVIRNI